MEIIWTSCVSHKYKQRPSFISIYKHIRIESRVYFTFFILLYTSLYTCVTQNGRTYTDMDWIMYCSCLSDPSSHHSLCLSSFQMLHFSFVQVSKRAPRLGKSINRLLNYIESSAFLEIVHKCFGSVKIKRNSHNNDVYIKRYSNTKSALEKVCGIIQKIFNIIKE